MDFSKIRDIFTPFPAEFREHFYIDSQIVIIHGSPQVFKMILRQDPPFIINDHRLGIVIRGEVKANINLVEKRITARTRHYHHPLGVLTRRGHLWFRHCQQFPIAFPTWTDTTSL